MKETVLGNFQRLMKGDENVVIKSTQFLLKHLSESGENELNYTLTRLIRGLGGSKNKVQSNYFTALIVIFNTVNDIQTSNLFDIINKTLQTSNSNSKGENADICMGQILMCGAIIRSPMFEKISLDEQKKLLEMMYKAGKQRSYLKLEANAFFVDVLHKINDTQYKELLHPIIKDDILKDIGSHDQDSLYLLICCCDKFPGQFKKKLLQQFIGSSSLICEDTMKIVANMLMNTPSIRAIKHPIYELILDKITKTCLYKFLDEFEMNLARPNYNRHLTAAHILQIVLHNINDTSLSIQLLFTKNFMLHTMHYYKNNNNKNKDDLGSCLQKLFKTLVEKLQNNANNTDDIILVLKKLLFWPGSLTYDQVSKSTTVSEIINNMNADGVRKVIEMYKDIVLLKNRKATKVKDDQDDNCRWLNSERLHSANVITKLLRHPSIANDIDFKRDQIIWLTDISLFKNEGISLELATSLKKVFYSALDQRFAKLEHLSSVLADIFNSLNVKLNEKKELIQPMQPSTEEVWSKTLKMIEKIEKKRKKKKNNLNNVFYTMFLLMAIQLFQHHKLAEDCLNELFNCWDRVKNTKNRSDTESEEKEHLWIEVVIDLFLNLLSQNSHLFRNMIVSVFPHLCEHLTTSSVRQMLYVLDPKKCTNPLLDYKNYDDDNDDDSAEEDDEDNGMQIEEDDEDDEDDDDDDDGGEDETVNDKLRLALQKALSAKEKQGSDDESVDLDKMSDSEGNALDKALSAVFKQYKPNTGKKGANKQQDEDRVLTHFRVRVLDLIKTYVNTNPSMLIAIEILLPLLNLMEFSIREAHQEPLRVTLKKCIEKMAQLRTFTDIEGVDETTLIELLKSLLLDKGTRNVNIIKDMDSEFSNACIFVLRCVQYLINDENVKKRSKKKLKEVYEILRDELNNYFVKRDALTPYVLWKDLISFDYNVTKNLIGTLVNNAFDEGVKLFKRSQALQLIVVLYSNNRMFTTITDEEKETLTVDFVMKSKEFLTNLCTNTIDCMANEKFIATLFNCMTIMKKSVQLQSVTKVDDFASIGILVRDIRSKVSMSANCSAQYKTLCRSLGIDPVVAMNKNVVNLGRNENVEDDLTNGTVSQTKRKKRKKVNEEERMRKKRKIERVKLLSEDLTSGIIKIDDTLSD